MSVLRASILAFFWSALFSGFLGSLMEPVLLPVAGIDFEEWFGSCRTKQNISDASYKPTAFLHLPACVAARVPGMPEGID